MHIFGHVFKILFIFPNNSNLQVAEHLEQSSRDFCGYIFTLPSWAHAEVNETLFCIIQNLFYILKITNIVFVYLTLCKQFSFGTTHSTIFLVPSLYPSFMKFVC